MKPLIRLATAAGLLFAAGAALAASNTPVGTWKTIDDKTHQPKSIVQITEVNGELQGKVLQVLQSEHGPNPVCDKCDGERKGKPVKGMVILWGIRKNGDTWDGGKILDPASGKVYSVKVTPQDGGKKLEVRGFIGFSLIGRNQTWMRHE